MTRNTGIVGTALIIVLATLVILLAKQNQDLKNGLQKILQGQLTRETLKKGAAVTPASFIMLTGENFRFEPKRLQKPQLLFVFSTSCQACLHSLKSWNSIATDEAKLGCSILSVSMQDSANTLQFTEQNELVFKVVIPADTLFRHDYKISAVPQTLLINSAGIIENVWLGVIDSSTAQEIEKTISMIH